MDRTPASERSGIHSTAGEKSTALHRALRELLQARPVYQIKICLRLQWLFEGLNRLLQLSHSV